MLVETRRLSIGQGKKLVALPIILALLLTVPLLSVVTLVRTNPVYAEGVLGVEINALATSTYAPKVATVIGKFCNTGTDPVTNAVAYIGNYTGTGATLGTQGSIRPEPIQQSAD
jgi:hypothetical protein